MKIAIYNPRTKDFSVNYAGKRYSIKAGEIEYFDKPIADHIVKHLANCMLDERGYIDGARGNAELSLKEYRKEIQVDLDGY